MKETLERINQLIAIHRKVAGINPALHALYPVVVVDQDQLLIYDYDPDQDRYQFIKSTPAPIPIPKGVRAAFQLADYGGRIVCVVSPDVFDTLDGYVSILHEFVHCYQYETCEQDLKLQLDIARQAQEKGDFMWEIQHPFPYQAQAFTRTYACFLAALSVGDAQAILQSRADLRSFLGLHDYEYLVWQEWKEGFARWVENRLQQALGLPENKGGLEPPFSRVSFYAGGEAYIDYLSDQSPGLVRDLEGLFSRMGETIHT